MLSYNTATSLFDLTELSFNFKTLSDCSHNAFNLADNAKLVKFNFSTGLMDLSADSGVFMTTLVDTEIITPVDDHILYYDLSQWKNKLRDYLNASELTLWIQTILPLYYL